MCIRHRQGQSIWQGWRKNEEISAYKKGLKMKIEYYDGSDLGVDLNELKKKF